MKPSDFYKWKEPKAVRKSKDGRAWNETHKENALSMTLASALAYEEDITVKFQLCQWGFTMDSIRVFDFVRNKKLETKGYVASNGRVRTSIWSWHLEGADILW
jgi:hypothetical protein